jgi:hypothetical protein
MALPGHVEIVKQGEDTCLCRYGHNHVSLLPAPFKKTPPKTAVQTLAFMRGFFV